MYDRQVQMAWREKVALNLIILFLSASFLFFIVGMGLIMCPNQHFLSDDEIASRNTVKNPYVSMYGYYYKINDIVNSHVNVAVLIINLEIFEQRSDGTNCAWPRCFFNVCKNRFL
jgi:hypothetical protein